MSALENFKHAETFANMPLGEKLEATGYVILLGMGITFVALITIWVITTLMSKVIQKIEKKPEISKVSINKGRANTVEKTNTDVAAQVDKTDNLELVAVITAAVATAMNTSVAQIHVSSIKRNSESTPTWGIAGRSELMNSRA